MILFGGTFDPVHEGHLQWAERIRVAAGVTQISLLPCAQPVHRDAPGASAQQRLSMLKLACQHRAGLVIDDCELRREQASYTVLTLREKRAQYEGEKLYWVVGQDSFNDLMNWREPQAILQLTTLIVMLRPSSASSADETLSSLWQQRQPLTPTTYANASAGQLLIVDGTPIDVSATKIRAALQAGERHPPGLPASVADYIAQQKLYTA